MVLRPAPLLGLLALLVAAADAECPHPGVMVTVVRADGLSNVHDVYAKVSVGTMERRTRAIHTHADPAWHTTFCFSGDEAIGFFKSDGLTVALYDHNTDKEETEVAAFKYKSGDGEKQKFEKTSTEMVVKITEYIPDDAKEVKAAKAPMPDDEATESQGLTSAQEEGGWSLNLDTDVTGTTTGRESAVE